MEWRAWILLGLTLAFLIAKGPDFLPSLKLNRHLEEAGIEATGPLASPSSDAAIDRKRQLAEQERRVRDLELRLKKNDEELSELDQKIAMQEQVEKRSSAGDRPEQALKVAQSDLEALQQRQDQQVGELRLKYAMEELGVRQRKEIQEKTLTQLRGQLQKEETTAARLHRQLQQLRGLNMDTDQLRAAETQAQNQDARVQQIQAQVLEFQSQINREEALARQDIELRKIQENTAMSANMRAEMQAALKRAHDSEQQIRSSPTASPGRDSAGEAGVQNLLDQYMAKKRENDLMRHEYEVRKRELDELKNRGSAA